MPKPPRITVVGVTLYAMPTRGVGHNRLHSRESRVVLVWMLALYGVVTVWLASREGRAQLVEAVAARS